MSDGNLEARIPSNVTLTDSGPEMSLIVKKSHVVNLPPLLMGRFSAHHVTATIQNVGMIASLVMN